ncbi:MAG: hypothetical protein WC284_18225 [Candidimonas sp.]
MIRPHNELLKHARRRARLDLFLDRCTGLFETLQTKRRFKARRRTARALFNKGVL